jgi:hypothetical protein
MTRSVWVAIQQLSSAYPGHEMKPSTLDLYLDDLAGIDPELLNTAARYLIRTDTFFPSIARIRETCAELALGLPTEQDALGIVTNYLSISEENHPFVTDALVLSAVRTLGGWYAFRNSTEPQILYAQFVKHYREARAAAIKAVQTSDRIGSHQYEIAAADAG